MFVAAGLCAIVVLSVFCLAYNYRRAQIKNESCATDYKWNPGQIVTKMTESFAWNKVDGNGFNNSSTAQSERPEILLVGSSHMEGFNIPTKQTVGTLLNKRIPTYNIGISGHNIYVSVDNLEAAVNKYKTCRYVMLETSAVKTDIQSMNEVLCDTREKLSSYDSTLVCYIKKYIPAVKLIYNGMNEWRTVECRVRENSVSIGQTYDDEYIHTLDSFIGKAVKSAGSNGAKLIIFYHPPSVLDRDGNLADVTDKKALELFKTACDNNRAVFVDMTKPFETLYEKRHILSHGFINTAVGSGHLNKYGHETIAETLLEVISEMENSEEEGD